MNREQNRGGTATFILNPSSGRARPFLDQSAAIKKLLSEYGFSFQLLETTAAEGSAAKLARSAHAAREPDLVFACGGDGTVHGVVQGLAGSGAALGIVPLGTANALARNLRIPLDPLSAVAYLLRQEPRRVALGEVETAQGARYFVQMAGCGPDGALIHTLPAAAKAGLGRMAYYAHAVRLFATRRWPAFRVRYRLAGSSTWVETDAAAVMASRVPDLGGLFSGMTRHAPLLGDALHVHLLRPPAHVSFAAWFALSRLNLPNPWLTLVEVSEMECTPVGARPVYLQADAEPLGTLPMRLRIVPGALSLLMPPASGS
jgi:diacylglycerol kinase family enzyme